MVVALVLTATAVQAEVPLSESQAIEKIRLLGGKIGRDTGSPGQPVKEVRFTPSSKMSEKYLHLLKSFPELESLHLSRITITDGGLKELASLSRLTQLDVYNAGQITNTGLKDLGKLENLERLNLRECKEITDDGVKELKHLKRLTHLQLCGAQITDVGLRELTPLTNLRMIDVRMMNIDAQSGVRTFTRNNRITDSAVDQFKQSRPRLLIVR